ncbi:pca operon transcription factor PcaQ [Halomonas denitrificans]|uniref:pca operon transcription factor PcaQ n=1 Tax=Halomonas denitrificans TaxID=370769 RepID=UPI001C9A09F9|nr:pca operon transcription factor PcaQ [Halomonas denitrificans]MBY5970027.1 pca operon transcription factor PcaQ [Halomonas denitrificans]
MLNHRIKLRHLNAFLEVSRRRSFARAADSLAITQPGISKAIRELEDIVGATLFERGAQGVTLTQAGLTLLRHAGPALKALEEGVGALADAHGGHAWLRIGALSTVESRLMPAALGRFQTSPHGPTTSVTVVTGASAYLLSRLSLGELDMVVGRMTEAREIRDLAFEHLYYESLRLVVRPGHGLAGHALEDTAPLGECRWVLPPQQTTLRQQVDSFCVRHAISLSSPCLETLSLTLSRRYTLENDAIWVAPFDAVDDDLQAGRLVELSLAFEHQGGSVGLCTNASVDTSLALDDFAEALRQAAAERQH